MNRIHVLRKTIKHNLFIVLAMILGLTARSQNFYYAGNPAFSAGQANYIKSAIDNNGTPYVVYEDVGNSNKASVMKLSGNTWVYVGTPAFTANQAYFTSIAIDASGVPYIAFLDLSVGKLSVMKFNGSNWVYVGHSGISGGGLQFTSIVIAPDGAILVAYQDNEGGGNDGKATVMKYDGSTWVPVGSPKFSAGAAYALDLRVDKNGVPYLLYSDAVQNSKTTVMTYNGSNWVNVGSPGFSAGQAFPTALAITKTGILYAAYRDWANGSKASLMKYNGSNWVNVAIAISSGFVNNVAAAMDTNDHLLIAYEDVGLSSATVLKKYDGTNWFTLGRTSTFNGTLLPSIMVDKSTNTPYVAFEDILYGYKVSVQMFIFPITGATELCKGTTTIYSDASPGGVWSTSSTTLATIDPLSGQLAALSEGVVTIMYTMPNGGQVTKNIWIYNSSTLSGPTTVCQGHSIQLSSSLSNGTWSSSDPGIAAVDQYLGSVDGLLPGVVPINFTTDIGCASSFTITVKPSAPIDGPTMVCTNQVVALSNSTTGGTWSTSNGSIATITNTGNVKGLTAGAVRITYTSNAGCQNTMTMSVNTLSGITGGTASLCQNQVMTLANATPGGGVWTSSNTEAAIVNNTGVVTGRGSGTVTISFTATNSCIATRTLTAMAAASITGPASVCVGQTITQIASIPGGAWSTSSGSIATATAGGVVSGASVGNVRISYILPAGCASTQSVTVNALAPITGSNTVCQNQATTFANTTPGGGMWNSDNPTVANVNSSGVVTGGMSGTTAITFTTNAAGCIATKTVTVNPTALLGGTMSVCTGQTTVLSASVNGGAWTSSSASLATVSAAGVVSGAGAGTVRITYALPSGCQSVATVTVSTLSQTSGTGTVCQGSQVTFTNSTPGGGVWSTSNSSIATVVGGTVTGAGGGTTAILFTVTNGCVATKNITVIPSAGINGVMTVCVGQSTNVSNNLTGGVWSTSSGSLATVSAAGAVWGVSAGMPRISYIWPNGCQSINTVTVLPLSPTTGGTNGMCASGSMTLANATPGGGVWTSSNTTVATVSATGFVKGTGVGAVSILFTTGAGCMYTRTVTVNACRETDQQATITDIDHQADEVILLPNPNTGTFVLRGSLEMKDNEEVTITIINMLGQTVYSGKPVIHGEKLEEQIILPDNIASGTYQLSLRASGGYTRLIRFIVTR